MTSLTSMEDESLLSRHPELGKDLQLGLRSPSALDDYDLVSGTGVIPDWVNYTTAADKSGLLSSTSSGKLRVAWLL